MDFNKPTADLVAIKGDKILLVTDSNEMERLKGPATKVIDCQRRTVVPGFNDAHCHIFAFVRKLLSLDLSPSAVGSVSEIKVVIYSQVQNTPEGKWLIGTGYNEFYLTEKRHPTRWDIDEVAPNHPVILIHRSMHACVLNSLAMSLSGITKETTEPPGGLIDRDLDTGEPNGVLFEMLGYIREKVLPPLSEDETLKGINLANRHYLSLGITSLQDATAVNNLGRWQSYNRFRETGKLDSRVSMMFGIESLAQFQQDGLTYGSGDSRLRLGGIKIMLSENMGRVYPSQSELNQQALSAHRAGFQLAIHAVEQSSVEVAIKALEYVQDQHPQINQRHRIEHCSHCPPRLLRRLSRLPVVIVTQSAFVYYSGERYLSTLPISQLRWLYPTRSLLNSGLIVADSSDCPVVPDNPLISIYAAVTRQAESGHQLPPKECITVGEALAMNTTNAAFTSFEESIKGSIIPGKLADMVVLSDNPVKSPPGKILDMRVEMTIIGGKVVWEV
jgi:predicted amidohydrolase YtcJ